MTIKFIHVDHGKISLGTLNAPFRELYLSFTYEIMTQKLTAAKYNNNKINKENQCRPLAV